VYQLQHRPCQPLLTIRNTSHSSKSVPALTLHIPSATSILLVKTSVYVSSTVHRTRGRSFFRFEKALDTIDSEKSGTRGKRSDQSGSNYHAYHVPSQTVASSSLVVGKVDITLHIYSTFRFRATSDNGSMNLPIT